MCISYGALCRYPIEKKKERKTLSVDNFNLSYFTKLLKISRTDNKEVFIGCRLFL